MTMSKYALAKAALAQLSEAAAAHNVEEGDAQVALLIEVIQSLRTQPSVQDLRGLLQYEIDSLGSGGVHEIQRGSGHG